MRCINRYQGSFPGKPGLLLIQFQCPTNPSHGVGTNPVWRCPPTQKKL